MSSIAFGTPISISLEGEIPPGGAEISRTYAEALPDDASVTFAYWNEEWEAWAAVPTSVASDRRSASAVVRHFSTWTDIIGGSEQVIASVRDGASKAGQEALEWGRGVLQGGAEAIHWSLGNLTSTRVELPECAGATPRWVDELSAGTNVNDPVRFCVGSDPVDPDLLVVKARPNRGYGFPVVLNVEPAWEYNSTAENTLADTIRRLGNLGSATGEALSTLYAEGRFVGPGEEVSFGIPATALRGFASDYLIELPAPSVAQYLTSTIAKALVDSGVSRMNGLLVASTAVAACWSGVNEASNVAAGGGALVSCLSSVDGQVAQLMGEALRLGGMEEKAAGKLAGKFIGRISIIASMLPTVLAAFDFAAEVNLPRNARALTITTLEQFMLAPTSAGSLPSGGRWIWQLPVLDGYGTSGDKEVAQMRVSGETQQAENSTNIWVGCSQSGTTTIFDLSDSLFKRAHLSVALQTHTPPGLAVNFTVEALAASGAPTSEKHFTLVSPADPLAVDLSVEGAEKLAVTAQTSDSCGTAAKGYASLVQSYVQ